MELPENMRTAWDHAEFKDLSREGIWRVEDVFWMLFGENGYVSIKSVKASPLYNQDPRIFSLLQDTKIAILTSRFGEFDKSDVESRLLFFSAHPLKFIDWINENGILDKTRDWGYSTHPLFVEIIESWETRRAEEETAKHPLDYILDYQRKAKLDVWSLKCLRRLLFHQGYAWEYFSGRYHRYDPGMEEYMRIVDQDIRQGLAIDRVTGSKGTNGRGEPLYSALELLRELRLKDYPIPGELIDAKERRDWATTEALLRQLHENMKVYVENGGRPVAPQAAKGKETPGPKAKIDKVKLYAVIDKIHKKIKGKNSLGEVKRKDILDDPDFKKELTSQGASIAGHIKNIVGERLAEIEPKESKVAPTLVANRIIQRKSMDDFDKEFSEGDD